MTEHRGASHSLLVLPWVGLAIWWLLRRYWQPVRAAPKPWFWAMQLALLTHPVLDAFTVYGTQLFWPFSTPPQMWASIWIVDLAYTVPLLAGCIVAWRCGAAPRARRWLAAGLVFSSAYLAWSLVAKTLVERAAAQSLAALDLADAPRFSVPLPLNTLLWQVVAMTPTGYVIGERSLVADRKPMVFRAYPSDTAALEQARTTVPALARLLWFNHGFMGARVDGQGRLIVSDLRMGSEPAYTFQFVVAQRQADGSWQPTRPERLDTPPIVTPAQLKTLWHRVWREP